MSIIMEGMSLIIVDNTKKDLDYVWKRLEIGHPNTISMRENIHVDDPIKFTRKW